MTSKYDWLAKKNEELPSQVAVGQSNPEDL